MEKNTSNTFIFSGSASSIIKEWERNFKAQNEEGCLKIRNEKFKADIFHARLVRDFDVYQNNVRFTEQCHFKYEGSKLHQSLVMIFDFKGNLFQQINTDQTNLHGSMILQDGSYSFSLNNDLDETYQWVSLRISLELIEENYPALMKLFDLVSKPDQSWIIYEFMPYEVKSLLKDLYAIPEGKSNIYKKRILFSRIIECMGVFYERLLEKSHFKSYNLHEDDLEKLLMIKDDIFSSLEQIPSIDDLSEKYGYSRSKFTRDFRKVYGTSVYQFHLDYRLEKAYELLKEGSKTITEVGRTVGYISLSKFSYAFKSKYKVSPKQVR
ncbi:AraC family transcriptional regulator [Flammeovirga sp. SubArs3]|uniref:helix-turn-helix domain-containing protein n=1 Tax=Flammeovirga sp. SubArs3 TaxID=2995316 RepID=UPI00248C2463|nr:AraC family transcriptional regulator [Flammeovirga sp. SubArs3]